MTRIHYEPNPWRMTPAELRTMRAYISAGSAKGAARDTGVSLNTVKQHMQSAYRRIGGQRCNFPMALVTFGIWEKERSCAKQE